MARRSRRNARHLAAVGTETYETRESSRVACGGGMPPLPKSLLRPVRNRAAACGGHEAHVLRQHAGLVARLGLHPRLATLGDLSLGDVELDQALLGVDGDLVALVDECNQAALVGFRGDMADHHAPGAAGEAAVGEESDRVAEALADQSGRRR